MLKNDKKASALTNTKDLNQDQSGHVGSYHLLTNVWESLVYVVSHALSWRCCRSALRCYAVEYTGGEEGNITFSVYC